MNPISPLNTAADKLKGSAADGLKGLTTVVAELGKVVNAVALPPLKLITDQFAVLGRTLAQQLAPVMQTLGDGFKAVGERVKSFASGSLAVLGDSLKSLGGSIAGALPEKLRFAIDVVKGFGESVGSRLKDSLGGVGGMLKDKLGGVGGYFGDVAGKAAGAIGGIAKAAGAILGAGGAAVGALVEVGQAIGGMVAKANPAAFARFQVVVDDLMAVFGQALTPVFETVTDLVRTAADSFVTFSSIIGGALNTALKPFVTYFKIAFENLGRWGQVVGNVLEKLAPAFAELGNAFMEIVAELQPLYHTIIDLIGTAFAQAAGLLADAVKVVIPYVVQFAKVVGDMAQKLMQWVKDLLAFMGIELDETGPGTKKGGSVGMAAKSATIGSVDSVIKAAQQAAYSLGTGAGGDPAKETASATKELVGISAAMKKSIDDLPKKIVDGLADKVPGWLRPGGASAAPAAKSAIAATPIGAVSSATDAALAAARWARDRMRGGSGTVSGDGVGWTGSGGDFGP